MIVGGFFRLQGVCLAINSPTLLTGPCRPQRRRRRRSNPGPDPYQVASAVYPPHVCVPFPLLLNLIRSPLSGTNRITVSYLLFVGLDAARRPLLSSCASSLDTSYAVSVNLRGACRSACSITAHFLSNFRTLAGKVPGIILHCVAGHDTRLQYVSAGNVPCIVRQPQATLITEIHDLSGLS